MRRDVMVDLDLESDGPARLVLAVGVAEGYDVEERFEASQSGVLLPVEVLEDSHGGRLHVLEPAAGPVHIEYTAAVTGVAAPADLDAMRPVS